MPPFFTNCQHLINWLSNTIPCFPVKGDQISVLHRPEDFYDTLINSCSQATQRISCLSLYLGNGEKEKYLVSVIKSRTLELNSSINVKIILDAIRGARGENNSIKMLLPLLENNSKTKVGFFHSPNLRGILRRIMPTKYNEIFGLLHMKVCVIDDNVLISGANLSNIYFTNRQDRYIVIKNFKKLADFYDGLINILYNMSLKLNNSNSLSFSNYDVLDFGMTSKCYKYHPYEAHTNYYINKLRKEISGYYLSFLEKSNDPKNYDTLIFPTIEVPPCDIHYDSYVTERLLNFLPNNTEVYVASGYFNLTNQLSTSILSSKANYNLLIPHPTANGFYESEGFSKYIPDLYLEFAKNFNKQVNKNLQNERIKLYEYQRNNYTFHCKGIWITLPEQTLPQITIIGSSNLGFRSKYRDLESQIILITDNKSLRNQLHTEVQEIFKYGTLFREIENKTEFWIKWIATLFRSYF